MKRRSVIMIIMTFMLLTLVGVGFATWIITAPTTDGEATGNIKVETVESKVAWQFDAYWVNKPTTGDPVKNEDANNIVFGAPEQNVDKAWLTSNGTEKENLTVYLFVKAKVHTDENKKVEVAANDIAKVDLKAVITTQTVGDGQESTTAPALSEYLKEVATVKVTLVDSDTEVKELTAEQLKTGVVLQITFRWSYKDGTTDVVENPYKYFNRLPYNEANATTAETYLKALNNKLAACSFKVVLTADVKTTQPSQG